MDQEDAGNFSEINEGEAAWLHGLLEELRDLDVEVSPHGLSRYVDDEWRVWNEMVPDQRPDPNPVINRVGAGLGVLLGGRLDLEWQVFTDRQGSDLAVRGEPSGFTFFPMSSVAKRWVDGELGWVEPYVEWAERTVREARSGSSGD